MCLSHVLQQFGAVIRFVNKLNNNLSCPAVESLLNAAFVNRFRIADATGTHS